MKKKKNNSYLEIPEDFNGFGYKEVKIRRAMLELRRDALKESMKSSVADVKKSIPSKNSSGTVGTIFSLGSKGASAVSSGKLGVALKVAGLGLSAFNFIRKIRNRK